MNRAELLDKAAKIITKDRNVTHGEPENSFQDIASLWTAFLGVEIDPYEVAIMMTLFKIARLKSNPDNTDNWIDLLGYGACGGELRLFGSTPIQSDPNPPNLYTAP